MASIVLLYSTHYGLSQRICERLATRLRERGDRAEVAALGTSEPDPQRCDALVLGVSVRHGKHSPLVLEWIRAHRALLEAVPSALFSVSLIARKPHRGTPASNPYLQALLRQSPWKPRLLGVFAGELDYARYDALNRQLMRFVMWINKGPTDPRTKVQFTDWAAVDAFAVQVANLATGPGAAASAVATATADPALQRA